MQVIFRDNMDQAEEYKENKYRVEYRKRMKHGGAQTEQPDTHTCEIYARNITEAREKAEMLLDASGKKNNLGKNRIVSIKMLERNRSNRPGKTEYEKARRT